MGIDPAFLGGVGRALASTHYRLYASGHIANTLGWWGNRLGVGWLTWELTGSAGLLGVIAFAGMIPVALIAPLAGVLADRYGHRRIAIFAGVTGGTLTLLMALITLYGAMTIPVLLVLSILQGTAFGVEFPARQALIPQLCKPENVPAALAFNSTSFQVGTFLGPVLAGFLIEKYGPGASILLFALTNYWMACMIFLIRFRPKEREVKKTDTFLTELKAGFKYIGATPSLRLLFLISLTSGILLRPYTELLAGFADVVYGGGPAELASLTAAGGLGALCSGVFLAFRGRTRGLVNIMVLGGILGSIGLVVFTIQTRLPSGIVIIALASMLLLACHVGSYSLIQNATNREMRGRVISVSVSITVGGPALGALIIGWFAEFVGLQWAVAASAVLALVIISVVASRVLKRREEMEVVRVNLD